MLADSECRHFSVRHRPFDRITMIKSSFTFGSYFTMVRSVARDTRSSMAFASKVMFAVGVFVFFVVGGSGRSVSCATDASFANRSDGHLANGNATANITNITNDSIDSSKIKFNSEPVISIKNSSAGELVPRRYERFLAMTPEQYTAALKSADDNEIDDKQDKDSEDPTTPLYGIYYDCLFRLSFQCVQRKLLVFLDRLSRLKSFNLIGDMISMVRNKRDAGPKIKESDLEARLNPGEASSALSALLEYNLERFFQNHVLRVTLPAGITASVSGNARSSENLVGNTIDINISRVLEQATGRGKGDKKMKKLMHMMMTGLMGKMAFMGPLMVMMIKLKALKALILSKIALMLSLFQMMKGGGKKGGGGGHGKEVIIVHDSHGGGGGHDSFTNAWPSGGGGGWSGGGGGGWFQGDSYSQGPHTGGGDATYSGSDAGYSVGSQTAGGWSGGGSTAGWGRRSSSDPHWVAYRAYIPEADE